MLALSKWRQPERFSLYHEIIFFPLSIPKIKPIGCHPPPAQYKCVLWESHFHGVLQSQVHLPSWESPAQRAIRGEQDEMMRPSRWGACRQSGILTLSLCQKDGPKGTPDLRGAISGGVHSHTSVTVGKGMRMGEGHLLLLSGKALDISSAPS